MIRELRIIECQTKNKAKSSSKISIRISAFHRDETGNSLMRSCTDIDGVRKKASNKSSFLLTLRQHQRRKGLLKQLAENWNDFSRKKCFENLKQHNFLIDGTHKTKLIANKKVPLVL